MENDWDRRTKKDEDQTTVEIDIRKILEQLGVPEEKWPSEFQPEKV